MTHILPRKKQQILSFIETSIEKNGYAPTLSDIAEHFKLSSPATVHEHLEYLVEHGYIRRDGKHIEVCSRGGDEEVSQLNGVVVPIVGLITAGAPIEAIEDRSETLTVPREMAQRPDCYILKVKGDSMIESFIDDGDFVVIQKQEFARDGDIVVALLDDGSATLKEYHKEKHYVRLQPRNPKYEPLRVQSVVIQGKVVGIIRKF
jgi:repressor LexA